MVRLEYAKRLKQAIIRGIPIVRQGIETPQSIERFKYIEDAPKIDYMYPEPPDAALVRRRNRFRIDWRSEESLNGITILDLQSPFFFKLGFLKLINSPFSRGQA